MTALCLLLGLHALASCAMGGVIFFTLRRAANRVVR